METNKQELVVKTAAPLIEANFETIKGELEATLHTYNLILTADTVTDGKTAAAQLNKMKQAIKLKEKQALETIMGPVDGFKSKIKELVTLVDETREKITEQVKIYEERTKDEIREKLKEYRDMKIGSEGLYEPFTTIEIEDLVLLGSQTKTGNLTKKVMETINGRLSENKNQQMQHEKEEEEKRVAYEARVAAEVAERAEQNRLQEERKAQERASAEIKRREDEIKAAERAKIEKEQNDINAQRAAEAVCAAASRPVIPDTPEVRRAAQEEINHEIEAHEMGVTVTHKEEHIDVTIETPAPTEQPPHDTTTGEITRIKPVSVYFEMKLDTGGASSSEVAEFTRQWITDKSPELGNEIERIGVTQPNGEISWNTK